MKNSAGWLPEMSFQTVLSIVGVAFSAFELYKHFRPKSSSPRAEPKQSEAPTSEAAGAEQRSKLGAPTSETSGNPVSSKIGMV